MARKPNRRRIKLIKPAFQLKTVALFLGLSAASLGIQLLLLAMDLRSVAGGMAHGGAALQAEIPWLLLRVFLFSFGMWAPVTFGIGLLYTHRIAGPVYRFEEHLAALARGEEPGPCRIRDGDEFQELCDRLNAAFAARRESASAPRREAA